MTRFFFAYYQDCCNFQHEIQISKIVIPYIYLQQKWHKRMSVGMFSWHPSSIGKLLLFNHLVAKSEFCRYFTTIIWHIDGLSDHFLVLSKLAFHRLKCVKKKIYFRRNSKIDLDNLMCSETSRAGLSKD